MTQEGKRIPVYGEECENCYMCYFPPAIVTFSGVKQHEFIYSQSFGGQKSKLSPWAKVHWLVSSGDSAGRNGFSAFSSFWRVLCLLFLPPIKPISCSVITSLPLPLSSNLSLHSFYKDTVVLFIGQQGVHDDLLISIFLI